MGIQAIAVSKADGKELGAFESGDDLFEFQRKHWNDDSVEIKYVPDSHMWDISYKCFVEDKIFPSIFDEDEVFQMKRKTLNPYYGYRNSVRTMLCQYRYKFVVLVKEGSIDEDIAADDSFITMFVAHNMDWVSDFVLNFASRCCGEVAIYEVDESDDVIRLFKSKTSDKVAFRVFNEKQYELFEEMWDEVGWHPTSVD